jgi:hypothetical protein
MTGAAETTANAILASLIGIIVVTTDNNKIQLISIS